VAHQDFELKGVFTAALTPLTADLGPDLDLLGAHGRWLLDNGMTGQRVQGSLWMAVRYQPSAETCSTSEIHISVWNGLRYGTIQAIPRKVIRSM